MTPTALLARCALCVMAFSFAACAPMRDTARTVLVAPVVAAAWTLDQVAPLPAGPASPSASPSSASIYNDRGDRLGTAVPRPDGSVDLYRANGTRLGSSTVRPDGSVDLYRPDGSRLGYSTPGRMVITPRR